MSTFASILKEEMSDTLNTKNAVKAFKELDRPNNVMFKFDIGDVRYKVKFNKFNNNDLKLDNSYEVSFYDLDNYRKNKDKAFEPTGKGNVSKVFSTMLSIMKRFIDEKNNPIIFFAANSDEKGRSKLYTRFTKQVSSFISGYNGKTLPVSSAYILYPNKREDEVNKALKDFA